MGTKRSAARTRLNPRTMALVAVNRYVEFTGHAATLELAETEVAEEHWSRR
jgi:hypothetical protein